jgi:hypothetical protein
MILNGTAPKALSPAGRWAVLGLGAVLLPLWPTWAHSQVALDNRASRPDLPDSAAGSAEDEGREGQISQARASVRELTSELKHMRAQVDALAGRLQDARARLARLEGRSQPDTSLPKAASPALAPPAANCAPLVITGQPALPALAPPAANLAPLAITGQPALAVPALPATNLAPPASTSAVPVPLNALPPQLVTQAPAHNKALGPMLATPAPMTAASPRPSPGTRLDRRGGEDYDQRLRALEAKLDRLLEEFKTLREQRPSRSSGPAQR